MAVKKPITVKQVEGAEVPTAVLAQSILDISRGMKMLVAGPLNERALLLLIQDAAGGKSHVSLQIIKSVLGAVGDLERLYVNRGMRARK
jgi:hypothetical protein